MLDASRAVVVVNSLLDKDNKAEYKKDIAQKYEEIRKENSHRRINCMCHWLKLDIRSSRLIGLMLKSSDPLL